MNRRGRRVVGWCLAALAAGILLALFHPRNWTIYTDGIAIRQAARDAELRLVLWEDPMPLEHGINSLPNNIEPVISNDGRILVFARGKAKQNADLFIAEWDGEVWSEPRPIEAVNTSHDELGPELNPDGDLLYFYSDRPEGEGQYDIWVSAWTGSSWDQPVSLGPAVNSPYNEYDPTVHPGGGRLYFSSNRLPDDGHEAARRAAWQATLRERVFAKDYDLFVAQGVPPSTGNPAEQDEEWHPEYRRGVPLVFAPAQPVDVLNTPADEGQADFTRRGDFLYFSSNRKGSLGGFDIYRARVFDGEMQPPERVGVPVSSAADDMDPALWLEGHSLLFSSNREDPAGQAFTLYQTVSREVVARFENARLALLWEWLKARWWLLLILLLSLLALVFLLRFLWDAHRRNSMSLTTKCLVGSVLAHVVLLFLLSLWFLSTVILESTVGPRVVQINDAALAREKMSLDLREEVTELKTMQATLPESTRVERQEQAAFQPAKQEVEQMPLRAPTPMDFVVDVPRPEPVMPVESLRPDATDPRDLPPMEFEALADAMEMPEISAVDSAEPTFEASRETPLDQQAPPVMEPVLPDRPELPDEVTLTGVPAVDLLSETAPVLPAPLLEEILPEVALPGALPVMEMEEGTSLMETREVAPAPESPEPAPASSSVPTMDKQAVDVPPSQVSTRVEAVELSITQTVARVQLEDVGTVAPPSPLETTGPTSSPPVLEVHLPSVEVSMEESRFASPHPPEPEMVLRKTVTHLAQQVEPSPSTAVPVGSEPSVELAALSEPVPLPEPSLSQAVQLPGSFDLTGESDMLRTELPDWNPGSNIVLESTPLTRMTFLLRNPETRERMIEQLGGNDETEAAISRALAYLQRTQEADGHWNIRKHGGEQGHEVAATGLALLCFMGHGATHLEDGPYRDNVQRAIDWLKNQQGEDGRFKAKDMYDQGIAGIALAEALALTEDPALRQTVQRSCTYIIQAQHKDTGGWRYQPNDTGDTSVFGWELMAIKSADLAGLEIPPDVFPKADRWLKRVGGGKNGGLYGYQDKSPKVALVAEGMFCRQLLGHSPREALMAESAAYLNTHLPHAKRKDYYYWYYGCLCLYQHQGPIWEDWNQRMREILVKTQDLKGNQAGSWNPSGDSHGNRMGRVVSTALATLSLEVYYRYLPMYGGLEDKAP